ncbi:NAD(P)H-binding protein [Sphingobacterium sp. HJSM2_6]|uniref:NAD(P)H-binding protein n=1 Tax=Sphingobacterium sp. HJSM2_6 TaxID=3366264 RepID=UPI003BDC7099
MKIIIIGATGATGRELVLQLLANKQIEQVTALVRKPFFPPDYKLKEIVIDFDHLTEYSHLIQGDVAISTLGTTLKDAGSKEAQWRVDFEYNLQFARLAKANQVYSFVLLSASQASPKSKLFYSKMKGELEEAIKLLQFPKLMILQPGPIIRPNSNRKAENISIKLIKAFNKLGLLTSYTPIHSMDLARVILYVLLEDQDESVSIYDEKSILAKI